MSIDKINPSFAANVYANMQKTAAAATGETDTSGDAGSASGSGGAGSFGAMLKSATTNAIDSIHGGEKASAAAITGKADLADVVQAVNGAEFTLSTVVAVRDRMLSAYDKVVQMSI